MVPPLAGPHSAPASSLPALQRKLLDHLPSPLAHVGPASGEQSHCTTQLMALLGQHTPKFPHEGTQGCPGTVALGVTSEHGLQ